MKRTWKFTLILLLGYVAHEGTCCFMGARFMSDNQTQAQEVQQQY
jgi:hypothetical protein